MVKENEAVFCIKFHVAASLKVKDRWLWLALVKSSNKIRYAFCPCEAGKVGTCSHMYAVMKLVAKWVLDELKTIPVQEACTSRPCLWSVPQSRGRIEKQPVFNITMKAPKPNTFDREKPNTCDREKEKKKSKGIKTTLYDARSSFTRVNNKPTDDRKKLMNLMSALKNENPAIPALSAFNMHASHVESRFGAMPLGSVVATQLPLVASDFVFYCSFNLCSNPSMNFFNFPSFPLVQNIDLIADYLVSLSIEEKKVVDKLMVSDNYIKHIEESTRLQTASSEWFRQRKHRITASINNKMHSIKTDRGLTTLASKIVNDLKDTNKVLERKMAFGRYHEPIAIQQYEKYMSSKQHCVQVEQSGLVIDKTNFVFGATPDGKIIDLSEPCPYGILEVKCSEEYQSNSPRDIIYISKTSCLEQIGDKIQLRKDHSYYSQIQMQLGVTTQSWCDFVLYTKKGLVIDRVRYDHEHWKMLQNRLARFYFKFMLPEIVLNKGHDC